jgi:hypothetical protein
LNRALLQHAQELDLHRRRHLGDLVEEDGAAVGQLEQPGLAATAPVKAPRVAEQLGVEQASGRRRS